MPSDDQRAEAHAREAESYLAEASSVPEGMTLGFAMRAAAHASLAVYHELRARRDEHRRP